MKFDRFEVERAFSDLRFWKIKNAKKYWLAAIRRWDMITHKEIFFKLIIQLFTDFCWFWSYVSFLLLVRS